MCSNNSKCVWGLEVFVTSLLVIVSSFVSSCARQPECTRLARCGSHSFSSYLVSDVEHLDAMIDSCVCVCACE